MTAIAQSAESKIFAAFRCGGKSGQKQNKTSSGIRIIHPESEAVAESREERSQWQNKQNAFKRLVQHPLFKKWHRGKTAYALQWIQDMERAINKEVDGQMKEENLRIEYFDPNK